MPNPSAHQSLLESHALGSTFTRSWANYSQCRAQNTPLSYLCLLLYWGVQEHPRHFLTPDKGTGRGGGGDSVWGLRVEGWGWGEVEGSRADKLEVCPLVRWPPGVFDIGKVTGVGSCERHPGEVFGPPELGEYYGWLPWERRWKETQDGKLYFVKKLPRKLEECFGRINIFTGKSSKARGGLHLAYWDVYMTTHVQGLLLVLNILTHLRTPCLLNPWRQSTYLS